MKWSDEESTERSEEREVEIGGGIKEAKEGYEVEGGHRDSSPAACAYHHHIDVILNSHVRGREGELL